VYRALTATQLTRGRARPVTILPDGTTLVERSARKLIGRERGRGGVVTRLVRLGAPAPAADDDLAAWLDRALRFLGATTIEHPGNYRYAFRLGSRRQRRRVRITGVVEEPYPTHRPPPVAVPTMPDVSR
jgi:hypothetical protein